MQGARFEPRGHAGVLVPSNNGDYAIGTRGDKMVKVIILSGIPGSGKSTWVQYNAALATVVSADHWFMRTGTYQFKVTELADAHGSCMRSFIGNLTAAVADGEDCTIVVDNTNTTTEEIVPYYAIAAAYGCEIELITLLCDPAVAAARNVHGVPSGGTIAMAKRLDERKLPDFWKYNEKFSQRTICRA